MKLRKNAFVQCNPTKCDKCARYSTHRIQLSENCIWQWLCDDHTRMAMIAEANYQISNGRTLVVE